MAAVRDVSLLGPPGVLLGPLLTVAGAACLADGLFQVVGQIREGADPVPFTMPADA